VLLDDDFTSIVAAVRLGRRIFDNIRKAIAFVVAVHVPIAGLSILPVFFPGWPLLLLPVHIVFLELVIDPSCTLIFEAEEAEPSAMRRPPRDPREPLFSVRGMVVSALQGVMALAACLAVLLYAKLAHTPEAARTLAFTTLVVCALGIIMTNRSFTRPFWHSLGIPNAALRWIALGTVLLLTAVLAVPPARDLLHFAPVHLPDLGLALAAGVASLFGCELLKLARRRGAPGPEATAERAR
jgi:P-type Ca2+ transporter type 2C